MTGLLRTGRMLLAGLIGLLLVVVVGEGQVMAQSVTTTTVQGTVYSASGAPGTGTLLVSWPAFTTAGGQAVAAGNTVVQIGADGFASVNLEYSASVPDFVSYAIAFSNDWANDLSIKTSKKVPVDAWLPAVAGPTYLANLSGLAVTAISATAVTVAAGMTPPSGGGFEVRRRDFAFQPGQDADLVLRSAVANFDIPRSAEAERFYVRVYDGSTPPNYSEFSVGLIVNLPLAAVSV